MKFDVNSLIEKKSNRREIIYFTYDFEFTHDEDQLKKEKK